VAKIIYLPAGAPICCCGPPPPPPADCNCDCWDDIFPSVLVDSDECDLVFDIAQDQTDYCDGVWITSGEQPFPSRCHFVVQVRIRCWKTGAKAGTWEIYLLTYGGDRTGQKNIGGGECPPTGTYDIDLFQIGDPPTFFETWQVKLS
jgi:hypothetical protein